MIVCLCNSLKDNDLKKICNDCIDTVDMDGELLMKQAGCKVNCGKCLDYIDNFIIPQESYSICDESRT